MQACFYERDGNDQQTYLLLLRHALLVLEFLPSHPEAKNFDMRQRLSVANRAVKNDLITLELLKPTINGKYNEYKKSHHNRYKEPTTFILGNRTIQNPGDQSRNDWVNDPALDGSKKPLQAGQNSELAVEIHRTELHRRDAAKHSSRKDESIRGKPDIKFAETWQERNRRLAEDKEDGPMDLSTLMQQVRLPKSSQAAASKSKHDREISNKKIPSIQSLAYPKVPPDIGSGLPPPRPPKYLIKQANTVRPNIPPSVPPLVPAKLSYATDIPPIPEKIPNDDFSRENTSTAASGTASERSLPDTRDFTFVPSAYLENGTPLRTIFLSPALRRHFLDIAQPNTKRNLETCGFLCGSLVSNALFVSHLIIPEQESTSDTCEMTNESAFFDYCDAEELIVLGWIHTHPTQTCFMSSRDLHTHAAYQAMMAESVAFVCAPSKEPS